MRRLLSTTALAAMGLSGFLASALAADLPNNDFEPNVTPQQATERLARFYGSIHGGASILTNNTFSGIQTGPGGPPAALGSPANVNLDYDTGFNVGGALGYRLPYSWGGISPRIEGELTYQKNDVGNGSNFNGGNQVFSGSQDSLSLFANVLFDYDLLGTGKFKPYIGGGVGVAFLDSSVNYFPAANPAANITLREDSSANFAFQAIVGASYQVTKNVELFVDGRYFNAPNAEFDRSFTAPAGIAGLNSNVDGDFDGFRVNGGVRVSFDLFGG